MKLKEVEKVLYFESHFVVIDPGFTELEKFQLVTQMKKIIKDAKSDVWRRAFASMVLEQKQYLKYFRST